MANVFTITPVTNNLKAENGSATTVFTVTNTTSRPLRGIAKIKPLGNTEFSWIKIEGETERDFPAGGTHQFTVNFNKPKPSAPPTTTQPAEFFTFRFDEISAANPDEDFTEGPVVRVEIPEQQVVERKPFPWLLAGIVAAMVLLVGGVVLFLVLRNSTGDVPTVEVLDWKTKPFAEAKTALEKQGFTVIPDPQSKPNQPVGVVTEQSLIGIMPATTEKREIKLTIPLETIMPKTVGDCPNVATNKVITAKLFPRNGNGNADTINNCGSKVISSKPSPDTPIAQFSDVELNFSCNPLIEKCIRFPIKDVINLERVNPKIKELLQITTPHPAP